MFDIEIPINAAIRAVDGECGQAVCVVVDPIKEKVTHLVVEETDPPRALRLVPIELVHGARDKEIEIKCGIDQLKKMESFVETEFLRPDPQTAWSRLWPFVEPETPFIAPEHQKIPAGEVTVRRGTPVLASDGLIGKVDELMIDRKDGGITHLVLREGHQWGQKDVSIPVSQIESLDQDLIRLKISKKEVEALPEIRIRRFNR